MAISTDFLEVSSPFLLLSAANTNLATTNDF